MYDTPPRRQQITKISGAASVVFPWLGNDFYNDEHDLELNFGQFRP